jgi:aerobic-type carbon monoxide dehydrogenase small subunit (CoxS/CutS family)
MAKKPFSRRSFLKGAGGLAAGGAIGSAAQSAGPAAVAGPLRFSGEVEVELSINGGPRKLKVEPRTTLLDVLRTRLEPALTGTKLVCDQGACGACTVLIDGRARYACMTLALDAVGKEVRTVEGLAPAGLLSPVQQAFWEEDASMCGFCTPGFVMSITGCLEKNPAATEEEVRSACSGNLCRCGTYPHVFAAAAKAGRRMRGEER